MGSIVQEFNVLDPNTKVMYIGIATLIIYTSVTIIDIKLGHIFALVVIVMVIYFMVGEQTKNSLSFNRDMDAKLDSLFDFSGIEINSIRPENGSNRTGVIGISDLDPLGYNNPPEFLYLDANMIELYTDIKEYFYKYNPEAYIKSLQATNSLLRIKKDFELELTDSTIVPNLKDNYLKNYKLRHGNISDTVSDTISPNGASSTTKSKSTGLINGYPMYLIAKEQVKLALNHIQSFIISIPSEPSMHLKFQDILERLHILLKRNLDIIYSRYTKKRSPSDSIITDYDNTTAYIPPESNFNFF